MKNQNHLHLVEAQQGSLDIQSAIQVEKELYKDRFATAVNQEHWLNADSAQLLGAIDAITLPISGSDDGQEKEDLLKDVREYTGIALTNEIFRGFQEPWLRNALVTHTALSLEDGQPDVVDPDKRAVQSDVAVPERKLLAVFLSGPEGENKTIPAELATWAFSAGASKKSSVEMFDAASDKSWGDFATTDGTPRQLVSQHIKRLEEGLRFESGTGRGAEVAAIEQTIKDLRTNPAVVFDPTTRHQQEETERLLTSSSRRAS